MFPFTSAQWEELEHQALIFKYLVSGIPIPPDLLYSVKRSCFESPFPAKIFPHHSQHVGWNYLQMGLGRKIDPEPGRCRRTDGKKWRCSKEAYPDSKYCERHMHRGKNRSRKPVELLKPTNDMSTNPLLSSYRPFSQPIPSTPPNGNDMSSRDTSTLLLLEPGSFSERNPDCRRSRFVSEAAAKGDCSASTMADSWQLTPLTMSCSSYSKQRNCSDLQTDHQHCYQIHQNLPVPFKQRKGDDSQKTIHRFFDEWPPKERGSWLDFDDRSSKSGSVSTTQLSISVPNDSNEFSIFRSRNP